MASLSPNIFAKDIREMINFNENIGFQVAMTVPEEGDFVVVMMTWFHVSNIGEFGLRTARNIKMKWSFIITIHPNKTNQAISR
ncbi:MAG: hypothetical protein K9N11_03605 [Lentisphaeria bacterium]|nr:hypothetical protein [Candidatus Neomarinimicrobiota bacterium]MCF7841921.1 hypothetical protein [Lentisphaeria bacterium]